MLKGLITTDEFIEITPSFKLSYTWEICLKVLKDYDTEDDCGDYIVDISIKCNEIVQGLKELETKLKERRENNG